MFFARLAGEGFWDPSLHPAISAQYGLAGDINFFGNSFGLNTDEFCVLRPASSELICNNLLWERRLPVPQLSTTFISPNGAVIIGDTPSFPKAPGEFTPPPTGPSCDFTESFADGQIRAGNVWKISDITSGPRAGKPVAVIDNVPPGADYLMRFTHLLEK